MQQSKVVDQSDRGESPVFIIGNPRSGTSLLRLMLMSHTGIVIAPECGFAVWLYESYADWTQGDVDSPRLSLFLHDLAQARKFETWNVRIDALRDYISRRRPSSYSDLVASVYRFYAMGIKPDFCIWGDKNNYYLSHIADIRALFPSARFIHVVRDGRSVACSYKELGMRELKHAYAPRLPSDTNSIAIEWGGNIRTIRSSFASFGFEGVWELRFEDLVSSPRDSLVSICGFLGLAFEPAMLEYYKLSESKGGEPEIYREWKGKNRSRLLLSEVDRFRADLSLDEIRVFENKAREQLDWYGYD
jgi:hypothetical protein